MRPGFVIALVASAWLLCGRLAAVADVPQGAAPDDARTRQLAERDRLDASSGDFRIEGKLSEARDCEIKALGIEREIFGPNHDEVASRLESLASLEQQAGDFKAARRQLRAAGEMYVKLHGENYYAVARLRRWSLQVDRLEKLSAEQFARYAESSRAWLLGKRHGKRAQWEAAARELKRAADVRRELFGDDNLGYLFCLVELAAAETQLGLFDEAESLLLKAEQTGLTVLSESDPARASISWALGVNYYQNSKYAKAERPLRQSLEVWRKTRGDDDPQIGGVHTALGHVLTALLREAEAEQEFRAALAIAQKRYGPTHFEVGVCEANLAQLLIFQERSAEADKLLTAALANMEKRTPADERRYCDVLAVRARLLDQMGRYREAAELCERLRAMASTAYGVDHPDYPAILSMQSEAYRNSGRYEDARRVLEETRDWYPKHQATRSGVYGYVLRQSAVLEHDRNRFRESDRYMEQALPILRAAEGDRGAGVVVGLKQWADMCGERGDFERAEKLYDDAIELSKNDRRMTYYRTGAMQGLAGMLADLSRPDEAVRRQQEAVEELRSLPGARIALAEGLRGLADIYGTAGRPADAEQTYRESLTTCEREVGREHPRYAVIETSFAQYLAELGRNGEADALTRHALQVEAKTHGTSHREYAGALECAAGISIYAGRSEEAVRFLTEAMKMQLASVGERSLRVATLRHNLGCAYLDLRRLDQAEEQLTAATATLASLVGKSNPYYAISLTQLGRARQERGDYPGAERLLAESAAIHLAASGEHDAHYVNALEMIAAGKLATKRTSEGLNDLTRVLRLEQDRLEQIAGFSDESSLRSFEMHVRKSLRMLVSFAVKADASPAARQAAADWILRRKGIVFASLCQFRDRQQALSRDTEARNLVEHEFAIRRRISSLALKPPADVAPTEVVELSRKLSAEADRLQSDLHRRLTSERGARPNGAEVEWSAAANRMADHDALVDLMRLYRCDLEAAPGGSIWLPARYYALVLRGGGGSQPQLIDLGPAAEIETAVAELRKHLQEAPQLIALSGEAFAEGEYRRLSRVVYDRVWRPLTPALGDAATIFVSPDSELNRIALETLTDEHGAYLAECYKFAYLTSGRELVRSRGAELGRGTVIFAGPDFDIDEKGRRQAAVEAPPVPLLSVAAATTEVSPTAAVRGGAWKPLADAAGEAADLTPLIERSQYGPVRQFIGPRAQEDLLKRLAPPRILHIATHGYFVEDEAETTAESGQVITRGGLFGSAVGFERLRASENPLLRSGVVLAGANRIAERGAAAERPAQESSPNGDGPLDDGWLTAAEIATLDLRGTELVVLSACETGLGDVPTGEGVQGLRRAFLYAGARTLVTSLYKVPDDATRRLMREFYGRLTTGSDKLTALNEARLAEMHRRRAANGSAHPFYWGSFILVGEAQ
ncbi:MAG: CHAT domain-containing protein [Planctomycetaceae bacterium]|nr:CHAT domain-containing protein [Planctomycetaceae bacterium]